MSASRNARGLELGACLAAVALVGAFAFGGLAGVLGMAMGLAGGAFSLAALWGIVRVLGGSFEQGQPGPSATILIVTAFFLKLPLLVALWMIANSLGSSSLTCFLVGLPLVYFAVVGWASASR